MGRLVVCGKRWGSVELRVDRGQEGRARAFAHQLPGTKNLSGLPAPRPSKPQQPDIRLNVARFFQDLRRVLAVTPHQAAAQLLTHADVIQALETCDIGQLPSWSETSRIVMAYAGWARVDGRPVLGALAGLIQQSAAGGPAAAKHNWRPQALVASDRIRRAGTVLKEGAARLPKEALNQARQQPARTLYAVSLPLGVLIVLMNTSILQSALSHLPGPFKRFSQSVESFVSTQFAPVREGFRWIEVDDPRSRRANKLPVSKAEPQKLQTARQSD